MEEDIYIKELSIILGLKESSNELNKIISDKNKLSFLGAISNILYSDNLDNLYDKNDSKDDNNEMIENFIQKTEIGNIGPVKLELYKDSNFIDNIKGNEVLLPKPMINYTERYLDKLQNDFIKEEISIIPPVEIKAPKVERNEGNHKNDRNKYKNKILEKKNKNKVEKPENQIQKEIKSDIKEKEEDKKEIQEKNENEAIEDKNQNFEEDEKDDKTNQGSSQQQNNRRTFNRKFNKNKKHKEYRQEYNSRKYKNYK